MIIQPTPNPPTYSLYRSKDIQPLSHQLISAAKFNNTRKIKELLGNLNVSNNPEVINYTDEDNNTALMWASVNGNIQGVSLLLKHEADQNIKNIYHYTALHLAVWHKHLECFKSLLKKGPDLDIKNELGYTAFEIAVRKLECCYKAPKDDPSYSSTLTTYKAIIKTFFKHDTRAKYKEQVTSLAIQADVKALLFSLNN